MSTAAAPQIEPLEVRRLFVVAGTAGDDVIEIVRAIQNDPLTYSIIVNSVILDQRAVDPDFVVHIDALGGNDRVTTDGALDVRLQVFGGDGNDTIVGGSQNDTINGGGGDDLLLGKLGVDEITGAAGNDTLRGGGGIADVLWGDDTLDPVTGGGADQLFGEDGNDQLHGGGGNDLLNGGNGNDALEGGNGDDLMYGAAGDDGFSLTRSSFDVDRGNDLFDGGAGSDHVRVEAIDPVKISLDGLANDAGGANVMPTVEQISATRLGGGSLIDASKAAAGVSISVADPVAERTVWVTVIGSPFADTITAANTFGDVQIDGRAGDDVIRGSVSSPTTMYGGAGDDQLFGGSADDVILGEDGDDFIEGYAGNDRIAAGVGNDIVWGDSRPTPTPQPFGSDTIEGNAGNDVLVGGGNNDVILGHGGRDTIIGGGGNDRMFGGPDSADTVQGGPGTDSAAQDDKDTYDSVETLLA